MKSFGTVLSVILATAVVVGGVLYFYFNDKLMDQKTDLNGQVEELKNRLTAVPEEKAPEAEVAPKTEEAKPEEKAVPTPATTEPSVPVQAADTSKWKTFTSSKFDYSVKYPLDWVYADATVGVPISIVGFRPKSGKDPIFNVTVEKSTLDFTIARIKKMYSEGYTSAGQHDLELNGQAFKVLNFESTTDPKIKPVIYVIAREDKVYYFSEGTSADATVSPILTAMASSFQLVQSVALPAATTTPSATTTKKP